MDNRINIIKNNTPLIDLRAPIEFNKGAFPSSVNIPILNNEQRSKVGIKYKKKGNNAAEKLGFDGQIVDMQSPTSSGLLNSAKKEILKMGIQRENRQ